MIKKVCLLLCVLLALPSFSFAGPASPDQISITQPDGTVIKARQQGDEFQNWTESESGHTILQNQETKYWEYGEHDAEQNLKPSGIRVRPGEPGPAWIPRRLKPPRQKELEEQHQKLLKDVLQERAQLSSGADSGPAGTASTPALAPESSPGDWTPAPVSGTRKMLVILVNFADRTLKTTPAGWNSKIFDTTANALSVVNYYKDNSFGKLLVQPAAHTQTGNPPGIITVTLSIPNPNLGKNNNYAIESSIISSALAAASPYIDFASYDTNGNGTIEQSELLIYFIYAGYEASGSAKTPNIWAHAWGGDNVSVAGKNVTKWALNGELNDSDAQQPMGVIAHEMGHALCGLPDLYDTSQTNEALGMFSIMASGSWGRDIGQYSGETPTVLDLWSREFLGWSTPMVPLVSGPLSIAAALASETSSYKLLKSGFSSTEYFLLENRRPAGWDLGLRNYLGSQWSGGLLLTHIDLTAGTVGLNDINKYTANNGRQGVIPVQADTSVCDMLAGIGCRGSASTLYYSGDKTSWGPVTQPNSNFYSGAASNFSLTGVSLPSAAMTATLSLNASTDDDIYEDNDTLATATPVQLPFSTSALKCYDDDWFKIWVQDGENIDASISFVNSSGDLDLYLFNSSGGELRGSNGVTDTESINYGPSLEDDDYYLKVTGFNGARNAYSLTVRTYTTTLPDLRSRAHRAESPVVTEGDPFYFEAYIYNSGLTAAPASHARLYLSLNNNSSTANDYYVGDIPVASLAATSGSWERWSFTMPNLGSGSYQVWGKVVVDSWNEVNEGVEDTGPFITVDSSDFTAYDVRTLTGLSISGLASINETSSQTYTVQANWSDGTTSVVASPAWSLSSTTYGTVSSAGLLAAKSVSSNQMVTLVASYTFGGVTLTASKAITIVNLTATLTGIDIVGPAQVDRNSSASYSATANWSDGSATVIYPLWSENSPYAGIDSNGVLTTTLVTGNQSDVITASYTINGAVTTSTKSITIVDTSVTLSSLTINGASRVNESSTSSYTATASWSDGTTSSVAPTWSASSSTSASITSGGLLTSFPVVSDQALTLNASYTYRGITKTATKAVTIAKAAPTLSALVINGAATVNQNATSNYTVTATWSDGTTTTVLPIWSVSPTTYASIGSSGALTTLAVASDQAVALTVSYTSGAVTKTATKDVTISKQAVLSILGDINDDNVVDIGDALMALRIAVGLIPKDSKYLTKGDVAPLVAGRPQPDGVITVADALTILRVCVGLVFIYPDTHIPGDLNNDGRVDTLDASILGANYGQTNCGNIADINGDCVVDALDYSILHANFGRSN